MSPFRALYGREAPSLPAFGDISSPVQAVTSDLQNRTSIIAIVKTNMKKSQEYMKEMADKKRQETLLSVGDYFMVRLQPF